MNDDANLIRVGDLAAATGLTVRALHHYEEIGSVLDSLQPSPTSPTTATPLTTDPNGNVVLLRREARRLRHSTRRSCDQSRQNM